VPFSDREFWARATLKSIMYSVERGDMDAAAAGICFATDRIVADPFNVKTSTMLIKAIDAAGGVTVRGRGWDEVVKCLTKLVSAIVKDACSCRLQFLRETIVAWSAAAQGHGDKLLVGRRGSCDALLAMIPGTVGWVVGV
jgi:hypothetical protein